MKTLSKNLDGRNVDYLKVKHRGKIIEIQKVGIWGADSEIYKFLVTMDNETGVFPSTDATALSKRLRASFGHASIVYND